MPSSKLIIEPMLRVKSPKALVLPFDMLCSFTGANTQQHTGKAKLLLMPGSTDLLFTVGDNVDVGQYISDVRVVPIPSIWGHASRIGVNKADNDFIDHQLKSFLSSD